MPDIDTMLEEFAEDLESSRDNQWAWGDRTFAEMNDARAATLRWFLDVRPGG